MVFYDFDRQMRGLEMASDACEACGINVREYGESLDQQSGLPESWFVRTIDGRDYTLCDCCGSFRQFKGGMSPYLQDALSLDHQARCVLDEVKTMAEARAKLRKKRVRRT